jgi:hypothetical protein
MTKYDPDEYYVQHDHFRTINRLGGPSAEATVYTVEVAELGGAVACKVFNDVV